MEASSKSKLWLWKSISKTILGQVKKNQDDLDSIDVDIIKDVRETKEVRLVVLALSSDRGFWPECISDIDRICFSKSVPSSPMRNFDFPTETSERRFSSNNYTRYLSNEKKIHRNWLVYSVAKGSIFCFYCNIFAPVISSLEKDDHEDWGHKNLDTTVKYFKAQKTRLELIIRLKIS
ncbi:zinc finger MYM-type protein 1 [Nephila pilipes]|uniref:Zinc finger MYM-type protein 1 n=1 Tax=Nephila pilipes TaxID=299642 RepID=A0A8X6M7R8_NEPPI|nr:zinc finger MYM-type protein 1 [Nephila pilipes]